MAFDPSSISEAQLGAFNSAVASGDYGGAAAMAAAAGVPASVVADYVNANAAGLGLGAGSGFQGVSGADIAQMDVGGRQYSDVVGDAIRAGASRTEANAIAQRQLAEQVAQQAKEDQAVRDLVAQYQLDPNVPIPYAVYGGAALLNPLITPEAISRVTGADPGFVREQQSILNQIQPSGYSDAQVAVWLIENQKGPNETQAQFEERIFDAAQASGVGIDQVSRVTGADPGYVATRYEEIAASRVKPPPIIPKPDLTTPTTPSITSIPRQERQPASVLTFAPLQRGLGQLRPAAFMPGLLEGRPGFGGSGFTPEQLREANVGLSAADRAYLMDVGGISPAEAAAALNLPMGQIQGEYNFSRPTGLFSTAPTPRPGPTIKDTTQLGAFNSAMARGDFSTAAQLAQAAGFNPQEVESYINQNLAGLNLAQPIAPGTIGSLYGPNAPTPPGLVLQTGAYGATIPTSLPLETTDTVTTPGSATNQNVLSTLESIQSAVNNLQNQANQNSPGRSGGVVKDNQIIKMAEGGMPKASAEEAGSKFDIAKFINEEGKLVGGYNRPIYEDNVLVGYEFEPYQRDVVFNPRLRGRESSGSSGSDLEMAMRAMIARQGRTGVSPTMGGLAGIIPREPVMRRRPDYNFAEGGLANAAQNLAARGRGGDSVLVHMAPEELSGLRALARAQGNDLTINPRTGLPEAFSLKKLFKAASFVLPFIPIPGLFGMSSLLTRSILSGVAAGASAKGGFDLKQALGGGLRAYAMGSLGEKMSGAATPGGTPTTPPAAAPEAAAVDVMGAGAPTITTPSGDVSLASSFTGPPTPASLPGAPQYQFSVQAPNVGGAGVSVPTDLGSPFFPGDPSATINAGQSSFITPEGQGFGQPLTKGFDIAAAGIGGLSIEEGAKEARNYELQAAAAKREEDEKERRFAELFRRTLGTVPAREGGLMKLAGGGMTYMEGGGATGPAGEPRVIRGTGDGMSDSVPATIEGVQEARLANDEFVIPADVVADIGNGSSDAGAKKLYGMMDRIRKARHGTTKQPPEINAERLMPA